jgi:hypothetical protein
MAIGRSYARVNVQVLFPLQEQVKQLSGQASSSKEPTAVANILIHHSRDTEEKQWAETRVLTLAGVARVFSTKGRRLCQLREYTLLYTSTPRYILVHLITYH